MKTTVLVFLIFAAVAGGCEQQNNQPANKMLVNYKSDTYGILLGDNYKTGNQTVDWQYDHESGHDSSFMFLCEPLIHYNNMECLPALHIKTGNGIIIQFSCSILFLLEDREDSIEDFLNIIGKDMKQLQTDTVKKRIISDGIFETQSKNHIETYTLTKKHERDGTYDCFEYIAKIITE